jgi:hypothetical protein
MPPVMPSWRSALSHVVADPERVVYEITTADAGYAFPDPGLFVGVTSVEKTNDVFRELDQVSRCPHLSPSLLFVHKYIQQ